MYVYVSWSYRAIRSQKALDLFKLKLKTVENVWESNLGPLDEKSVHLTTETSLQIHFFKCMHVHHNVCSPYRGQKRL